MRELPWNIARGFLMGAADVVPGVSGGTIALVLGIYRRLVGSIRAGSSAIGALLRGNVTGAADWLRRVDWWLLGPLIAGIGLAVVALAALIEEQLHTNPVPMAALFFGLVAGSVAVAWTMVGRRDGLRLGIMAAVGMVVFVLLGLREGTTADTVGQLTAPTLWAFAGAGALAICAMILPGISGSFILVLLGMYGPVLGAVNDRDLVPVGVFLGGATVGLALFSQVLHWALATHHDAVMAALIGLMLGSARILWPWPDGVDSSALGRPDHDLVLSVALALGAFVAVVVLYRSALASAEGSPGKSSGVGSVPAGSD